MKLLLIFVIACLAVYDTQADSLKNAIGMPEAHELDQVDNDFREALLHALTSFLDKFLDSKKALSEAAQRVIDEFLTALGAAKVQLGSRVKQLLEDIKSKIDFKPLKELIAKLLGLHTNSSSPANGIDEDEEIVKEVSEHILEKITSDESLEHMREYIDSLAQTTKLEVVHALRALLAKFDNAKLRQFIKSILSDTSVEKRSLVEFLEHIRTLIKDFGVTVVEKFRPFIDWVIAQWTGLQKLLKDKVGIMKAIATELLEHGSTISKIVAEEAKAVLQKYKDILGSLYKPLMKELTGIVDTTPSTL